MSGKFLLALIMSTLIISEAYADNKIANQLNERFNSIPSFCIDKPGYVCSGVLIHINDNLAGGATGIEISEQGIEHQSVSLSFLRRDLIIYDKNYTPVWSLNDDYSGIILSADAYDAGLTIKCMYAFHANSQERADSGCSNINESNNEKVPVDCFDDSINTAKKIVDTYYTKPETFSLACSWPYRSTTEFNEWLKIPTMVKMVSMKGIKANNEIIFKEWSGIDHSYFPLDAYFYIVNYKGNESASKQHAQTMQVEYFNTYGKFIPIVMLDFEFIGSALQANSLAPFKYNEEDQVIKPLDYTGGY